VTRAKAGQQRQRAAPKQQREREPASQKPAASVKERARGKNGRPMKRFLAKQMLVCFWDEEECLDACGLFMSSMRSLAYEKHTDMT
jgi:hypothetical protein